MASIVDESSARTDSSAGRNHDKGADASQTDVDARIDRACRGADGKRGSEGQLPSDHHPDGVGEVQVSYEELPPDEVGKGKSSPSLLPDRYLRSPGVPAQLLELTKF